MKTTDILNMARELGQALAESNELKELKACEKQLFTDAEAQAMLNSYRQLQMDYERACMENNLDEADRIVERMEDEQELMNQNKTISDYAFSRNVFEKLLNNINNIISYALQPVCRSFHRLRPL
jgi:cell fate (sporulation/competence/biofilm development) regulator YlbF (YheA/YmcA/DUF963 family)